MGFGPSNLVRVSGEGFSILVFTVQVFDSGLRFQEGESGLVVLVQRALGLGSNYGKLPCVTLQQDELRRLSST